MTKDGPSINRIRLEFKGYNHPSKLIATFVLIESDWNLKQNTGVTKVVAGSGINRIRLEFKVLQLTVPGVEPIGINRIRLEFKEY